MSMKFMFKGLGDYATAVAWLDRANAIPMAMPDVREGVKVSHAMCMLFVAIDVCLRRRPAAMLL